MIPLIYVLVRLSSWGRPIKYFQVIKEIICSNGIDSLAQLLLTEGATCSLKVFFPVKSQLCKQKKVSPGMIDDVTRLGDSLKITFEHMRRHDKHSSPFSIRHLRYRNIIHSFTRLNAIPICRFSIEKNWLKLNTRQMNNLLRHGVGDTSKELIADSIRRRARDS